MSEVPDIQPLPASKKAFVETWGEMGPTWGINRTMAQIHALLMVSDEALSTDEVMAHLRISRGNANTNLRELVSWSLVHKVVRLGERREFFEAEKQTWRIFCNIARERKRREIDPLTEKLNRIRAQAETEPGNPAFRQQLKELQVIVDQASVSLDRLASLRDAAIVPLLMRALDKLRPSRKEPKV